MTFLALCSLPLASQAPEGWVHRERLGEGAPGTVWYGAGLWAADQHGPASTLVDSLGLGNALTGSGIRLEGGLRSGAWEFAGEALGQRFPDGGSRLVLHRAHIWRRGVSGWQGGLEQEPLVWGYGLNGGYLLGEAARPFPRLRLESPMTDLGLGRARLGTWGVQAFLGRLESPRILNSSMQDLSRRRAVLAAFGEPQAPLVTGIRLQARFGELTEFYANYLNLWGGTLNGRSMLEGYGTRDYLTAMLGAKDSLAESDVNFNDPARDPQAAGYKNKARSGSELDIGFRIRVPALERGLGARRAQIYLSRGSKSLTYSWSLFLRRPLHFAYEDVERDMRSLGGGHLSQFWNQTQRTSVPNLADPNDTFGLLLTWPRVRLGLEYADTTNLATSGHRTFAHGIYLSGFYTHGDPMGNAIGGEARTATLRAEVDLTSRLTTVTWVHKGASSFRDDPALWSKDHPGQTWESDRFHGLQQTLDWKVDRATRLRLGASWRRHGSAGFVSGREGNGFSWFADLGFRWPSR